VLLIISVFFVSVSLPGINLAQQKVVVIPLMDDCTYPPTDFVPDPSPSKDDYNLEGDIVKDRVTGLIWQTSGSGPINYAGAVSYCQTLEPYEGINRFRLPTVHELMTIMDFGGFPPLINDIFTDTSSNYYWTSTQFAGSIENVWVVGFLGGIVYTRSTQETNEFGVRCVMGQTVTYGDFKDNDDGTVSDLATGLIWQQQEHSTTLSWSDAIDYCSDLELGDYKDWRLPNIKELHSIIDAKLFDPALEFFAFPEIGPEVYFWSATSDVDLERNAYSVNIDDGFVGQSSKNNPYSVRCVRSKQ
jgi:hypothetical protein